MIDHRIDGIFELQDLAFHFNGDLAAQIAARDGCGYVDNISYLTRQVGGHRVDVVGEIFPGSGDARHHRLSAKFTVRTHLTSHTAYFRREAIELINHRVDGVFQSQDFALYFHRDLFRKIPAGHCVGYFGDVANLPGEVRSHRIHIVGQVLPRPGHAFHRRLATEFSVGTHLSRDAGDFGGEGVQLIDHRIEGVLQGENFAFHFDRDFGRKVTLRNGRSDVGNVSHLPREVGGHEVHIVGEILPRACHTGNLCLATQFSFGAHLARHAAHLTGKSVQLIDHRIDGIFQLEDFAFDFDGDFAAQVAARDRCGNVGDVAYLRSKIVGHGIDVIGEILPCARHLTNLRLAAQLSFRAHLARHAGHFGGEGVQLVDHRVEGVLQLQNFALHVDCDLLRQISVCHGRRHIGDVANLASEIRRHGVDVVREILPRAGHAGHLGLSSQLAFRAHFTRYATHFTGEPVELIDHRIDGVLEFQNLAAHVDGDLLR